MLAPPSDLDSSALVGVLVHWGIRDPRLEYLPVGFGSHRWRAENAFVTVDDLAAGFQGGDDVDSAFAALERAYRTAARLRDGGRLEFVLAPLDDDEGVQSRRIADRYAVNVAPFVDGTSSSFGAYESKAERRRMAELLGRLHAAGEQVPAGLPRRDDLRIPSRSTLDDALADVGQPWQTGPFARAGWDDYCAVAGDVSLELEALELYRQRWDLADIAAYVGLFRRAHEADENAAASFGHLRANLDAGRI